MREIKFRAWQVANKEMYQPLQGYLEFYNDPDNIIVGFDDGDIRLEGEDVVLMQYTGLKDESGVEIYEGDVFGLFGGDLERPNEYEFHAKVYFDNDFSAFCVELYNGGWEYLSDYLDNPKNEREVIGNIYQNSELLGEQ